MDIDVIDRKVRELEAFKKKFEKMLESQHKDYTAEETEAERQMHEEINKPLPEATPAPEAPPASG